MKMNDNAKYEEALERARTELNADISQGTKNVIQTIFPELKESTDEIIRKEIRDFIEAKACDSPKLKSWLEWLAKQKVDNSTGYQELHPMSLDEAIDHCKSKSCGTSECAQAHKQLGEWLQELKQIKTVKRHNCCC